MCEESREGADTGEGDIITRRIRGEAAEGDETC
jgi:hypothetical protein